MHTFAVILVPLLLWLVGLGPEPDFDEPPPRVGEVRPDEGWCCRDPIWVDPYREIDVLLFVSAVDEG